MTQNLLRYLARHSPAARAAGWELGGECIRDGERVQMVWRSSNPHSPDRSAVFSEAAGALPRVGDLAQFSGSAQRVWRLRVHRLGNLGRPHPIAELLVNNVRV